MEWAQEFVEQYGYWAVFAWTFIEGETVFIVAAALGFLDPYTTIMVAASGAFSGHLVYFAIGRWKGEQLLKSTPWLARQYPKVNKLMDEYGNWTIFIFQYLYGARLAAAILFGCSTINFWRFFFLQIINCITWAIVIYTAGHFLGVAAKAILHKFGVAGLVLCVLAMISISGYVFWRRKKKNRGNE